MSEDPFKAIREKLKKKKAENEALKAESLKKLSAQPKAPTSPQPKPVKKPSPAASPPPTRPARPAPAPAKKPAPSRRQEPMPLEFAPRGDKAPEKKDDPGVDVPRPKGLVKHHFAFEDISKMKKSKNRYAANKPSKFDSHRHDKET